MFTPEAMIDTIQNSKKQFVRATIKNEPIADAWVKFADTQAEYTKAAVRAFTDVGTSMYTEATKLAKEAATKFETAAKKK